MAKYKLAILLILTGNICYFTGFRHGVKHRDAWRPNPAEVIYKGHGILYDKQGVEVGYLDKTLEFSMFSNSKIFPQGDTTILNQQ